MVDINFIRENIETIKDAVRLKKLGLDVDRLIEIDKKRRDLVTKVENLRAERNQIARDRDIEKGRQIKQELDVLEDELQIVEEEFQALMVQVPTPPSADTPIGESEDDNVEVYRTDIPEMSFTPKDHIELGKSLDILDLEKGAKVGGYRGYYLKNEGAMLVMALMMYAMHKMVKNGYKPMIPPTLVKEFALFGSGYFKGVSYNEEVDEIYRIGSSDKDMTGDKVSESKFLVGTAEPSILAYFADEVLKLDGLPIKQCGYSQCYRSEIGSYGRDTKGMYRVHEFMKVEQVVLCPQDVELADKIQQEMINLSKEMHEELGLPHRLIQICTGDLSAGKYKQFDMEAWLPGMDRFGETGSASNFLTWQSIRLNTKYEDSEGKKKNVFMLNNTALPTPRIFIAILENHQQSDGSIKIPEVLVPFTGFSQISPKK